MSIDGAFVYAALYCGYTVRSSLDRCGFGGSEADVGVKATAGTEATEAARTFFKERCLAA